jgi:hypothetical protein
MAAFWEASHKSEGGGKSFQEYSDIGTELTWMYLFTFNFTQTKVCAISLLFLIVNRTAMSFSILVLQSGLKSR